MDQEAKCVDSTLNINDQLCGLNDKPRRAAYFSNQQHKAKCLHKYIEIDNHSVTDLKDKTFTHFNFKKTNARRLKYAYSGCTCCRFTQYERSQLRIR
jgi:hypothetical protein